MIVLSVGVYTVMPRVDCQNINFQREEAIRIRNEVKHQIGKLGETINHMHRKTATHKEINRSLSKRQKMIQGSLKRLERVIAGLRKEVLVCELP